MIQPSDQSEDIAFEVSVTREALIEVVLPFGDLAVRITITTANAQRLATDLVSARQLALRRIEAN
jgi:hypothetical protein